MIIFLDGALESFAAFDSREENSAGGEDASAADREAVSYTHLLRVLTLLRRRRPATQEQASILIFWYFLNFLYNFLSDFLTDPN